MKEKLIGIGLCALLLSACESEDKTYNDCTKVRFTDADCKVEISPFVSDAIIYGVPISVIGKTDNNLDYGVRISEGAENIPNGLLNYVTESSVAMGQYTDTLNLQINPNGLQENQQVKFTLSLTAMNDAAVAHNYANCEITIRKQRLVDFFLGKYDCYESTISGSYDVNFVKDGNSDSTILCDNFWNFNATNQKVRYVLHKNSQTVDIPVQSWTDSAMVKYEISGSGNYYEDGSMSVNYTMMQDGNLFEKGLHKFTKK